MKGQRSVARTERHVYPAYRLSIDRVTVRLHACRHRDFRGLHVCGQILSNSRTLLPVIEQLPPQRPSSCQVMISAAAAVRALVAALIGRAQIHEALDKSWSTMSLGASPSCKASGRDNRELWTHTRSLIFEIVGQCAVTESQYRW